jgi:hypothetical protein
MRDKLDRTADDAATGLAILTATLHRAISQADELRAMIKPRVTTRPRADHADDNAAVHPPE